MNRRLIRGRFSSVWIYYSAERLLPFHSAIFTPVPLNIRMDGELSLWLRPPFRRIDGPVFASLGWEDLIRGRRRHMLRGAAAIYRDALEQVRQITSDSKNYVDLTLRRRSISFFMYDTYLREADGKWRHGGDESPVMQELLGVLDRAADMIQVAFRQGSDAA